MPHTPRIPTETPTLVHDPVTKTLSLSDLPVPLTTPNTDEHLILIYCVALTRNELTWPEPLEAKPYSIPGYELSGTVLLAPTDSPFQPGAEVIARTDFVRPGNARGYSIATTAELGPKPKNLGWEEACCVPLSGLTAWQALFTHGGLKITSGKAGDGEGDVNTRKRVLVSAAAGGVGIFAVQLAKLAGAYVVGICGSSNVEFVRSLGADEILDYRQIDLLEWVKEDEKARKFDLVLDCVGGEALEQAWKVVRDNGTLISVAEPVDGRKPKEGVPQGVRSKFFIVEAHGEDLRDIVKHIEEDTLRAVFDSSFKLDEYAKAFEKMQSGRLRGKVVLKIRE